MGRARLPDGAGTARAAIDTLLDLGRPRCARLAVIADRGHRELPIQADHLSFTIPTERGDNVEVQLAEDGFAEDGVVLFKG